MPSIEEKKAVSIVIPAYNKPNYTRRVLQSIVEQEHRPIEVILSDDCSPTSLEAVVKGFRCYEGDSFTIKFYRQHSNLGVMGNFTFAIEQATGAYVVPWAHDNWFVDKSFLSEAVEIMETHPTCHMCLANASLENGNGKLMRVPKGIDAKEDWFFLEGDAFIPLWLDKTEEGIGLTYAVVLDHHLARSLGAFHEPFQVSEPMAKQLGLASDNVSAYVYVLASVGAVGLTDKVVCIIGTPEDSYSRGNKKWRESSAYVKFIVFYNIYRARLDGKYARAVKKAAIKQALRRIKHKDADLDIIRYYRYDPQVVVLMCLLRLRRPWLQLKRAWSLLVGGEWSLLLSKIRSRMSG